MSTDVSTQNEQQRIRPRRSDVREQILAAAREAFGEHGYAAVSVAEVARRAGFTKGAVYSNFGSKPELFAAAVYANFADLVGDAVARALSATDLADGPDGGAARVLASRLADSVGDDSRWPSLMAEFRGLAAADPELQRVYADLRLRQRDELVAVLDQASARVGLRPGLDLEVAATLLLTCVNSLSVEYAVAPESVSRPLIEGLLTHVIESILA